ncbi:MAG: hypothetical protein AAF750_15035 [Planctomycetota bacterium]
MGDLKSVKLMYLKAVLFVGIGLIASALILLETPSLRTALFLVLAIWGFCRAYYFVFYVIGHYIDPGTPYAGLFDFLRRNRKRSKTERGD